MHRDPLARARTPRRALTIAVLAAALAAAPATAQPRKEAAAKPAARTTPLAATPPAAAAIPLPPPPSGGSQVRRAGWLAVSAGPWSGLDSGSGAAFQVDYGYLRTPPGWRRVELELHLAVLVSRATQETELTTVIQPPFGTPVQISSGLEKTSAWIIEAVPMARARVPFGKIALLFDGGLGLVQTLETHERDELFAGHTDETKNVTGLVLRLGGGMAFELSERARLVFLPVQLSFQLGTGFSAYVPTLGLAYRL